MKLVSVSLAVILLLFGSILGGCASMDAHVTPVYTVEPGKKSPLSTIPSLAVSIQVEDQRNHPFFRYRNGVYFRNGHRHSQRDWPRHALLKTADQHLSR